MVSRCRSVMIIAAKIVVRKSFVGYCRHHPRHPAPGSKIEAQITVQGFFKDYNQSASIWRAGEYYTVNSPSLMLDNVLLGCANCVYEQNDAGSTTTLTMMLPDPHERGVQFPAPRQRGVAGGTAGAVVKGQHRLQPR
jgi:hypothetical protein